LSDIFAGIFNNKVLYIANEQHYSELNDTATRLQLKHMPLIHIVKAMGGVQHDIGEMLLHYKPCLTILDSVTKWSGEDMNEAVTICQRFKDYTVRLNAPTIVINQVTKSGDHAGLNKMKHAVDATAMFEILGDGPTDPRRLHIEKNRNGPAPISQYFDRDSAPTRYYSPVLERIRKLKLKMRYHNGEVVNFGSFDYSFMIEFDVVQPHTINKNLRQF
jgi:predicted ATP-dependent serine protease